MLSILLSRSQPSLPVGKDNCMDPSLATRRLGYRTSSTSSVFPITMCYHHRCRPGSFIPSYLSAEIIFLRAKTGKHLSRLESFMTVSSKSDTQAWELVTTILSTAKSVNGSTVSLGHHHWLSCFLLSSPFCSYNPCVSTSMYFQDK